jgi:hypothetical protein
MLKNALKRLSAVLAVSTMALVVFPASPNAMINEGNEETLIDITACALKFDHDKFSDEEQNLYKKIDISPFSSEELSKLPVTKLVISVADVGISAIRNLKPENFSEQAWNLIKKADNWHERNKNDIEGAHKKEKYEFLVSEDCNIC